LLTRRFVKKHVLITGAGSGFGRATARRFAAEGAETIYLVDRREDRILAVAEDLQKLGARGVPILVDLGDIDACDRAMSMALADSPRLDILVSNAAAWTDEPFLEMKDDSWLRVIAVNLTASFILGQRAARAMASRGGGVILYTASVSGLGASRGFAHYCATKAGIISLVQTMSVELAPFGIRVNAVSPGPADTQQSVDLVGEATMETFRKSFPVVPMNRLASEHDIASAFLYLASEEAGYVTGHNFVVDGGLTAQVYDVPNPEAVEAPAAGG
jgi:NAD(P)-dependent dehydrogenase (short-subunit alcohol dehydrogenase family)